MVLRIHFVMVKLWWQTVLGLCLCDSFLPSPLCQHHLYKAFYLNNKMIKIASGSQTHNIQKEARSGAQFLEKVLDALPCQGKPNTVWNYATLIKQCLCTWDFYWWQGLSFSKSIVPGSIGNDIYTSGRPSPRKREAQIISGQLRQWQALWLTSFTKVVCIVMPVWNSQSTGISLYGTNDKSPNGRNDIGSFSHFMGQCWVISFVQPFDAVLFL